MSICEADSFEPFLGLGMLWSEYFEMKWFPIVDGDQRVRFIGEATKQLEAIVG